MNDLQILSLSVTVMVTVMVMIVGYWQYGIARSKLTHDLFDRRVQLYRAAKNLIIEIRENKAVTKERIIEYLQEVDLAHFLLDYEMARYLRSDIGGHAESLLFAAVNLKHETQNRRKCEEIVEMQIDWFGKQLGKLDDKFSRFLAI